MDKRFSIDRFEEGVAVLIAEDGGRFHVLSTMLPPDAREGDLLELQSGRWTVLPAQTQQMRDELFDLQESLFDD